MALAAGYAFVALCLRHITAASLASLFAAGVLFAAVTKRGDERCAELILRESRWKAVLEEDVRAGDFSVARLSAGDCEVRAAIAIASGRAAAGSVAWVSGFAQRGERGIVVQRAALARAGGSSPAVSMRAKAARSIDALFGEKAGVVRALLVADANGIDPQLRDTFADAGLVHMLSISGLHVGIIAAATQLLLVAMRMPQTAATIGSAFITALYIIIIGAPSPAVRAGAMLFVVAASRLLQRPTSPWAALAAGALAPLMDVRAVLTIGYQLSVTGMVGLISAGICLRRTGVSSKPGGWRGAALAGIVATVLASLATAPIIAWHFGRISLVAPLTNLVAAPLLVLLQPLLFLALALAPLHALASFAADASIPLLEAFEFVARVGAAPRWAALDVAPTLFTAAFAAAAAGAILAASVVRRPLRFVALAGSAMAVIVWQPLFPAASAGRLEIHLIDVGQGDAIAVRLPDSRWLLFDAGRSWRGGDAGRRTVIPYIRRHGGELFAFVLSHPHSDHVGGAESVIRWLKPRVFWDAAYVAANEDYLAALRAATTAGTEWRRVRPGHRVNLAGASLEFLAPDSAWTVSLADPNDASTVVMLRFGDVSVLLTGDAERLEEEWLATHLGGRLRATVLKVGHHGSRTSSTPEFLDLVRPKVALISVGAGNRYGHPSQSVLDELVSRGALIVRTDRHGGIVLSTDGKTLWLNAMGETWQLR